jgi:Protein of unknown function (DUF3306)
MTADSGRFARWSQRKAAARRGGALPVEPDEAPAPVQVRDDQPPAAPERNDPAPVAADIAKEPAEATAEDAVVSELPPVEDLTFQSDFTVFMRKNVPEAIRRAALRKLWGSDPVLANLDGLNDYCEDFNVIDTPISLAQTSYQVGKGYFDQAEAKLAELGDDPAGRPAEIAKTSSDSPIAAEPDGAVHEKPAEIDESGDEETAATRRAVAAPPTGGKAEPDDDKTA